MEGLDYLNSLEPWNGKGGFSLENIGAVLRELGDPQDRIPSVHIAGTNGKGSVTCATSSILSAAGHRVGMTISPHLTRVNERIVIDGCSISDDALNAALSKVKAAVGRAGTVLTLHEAITAASFLAFVDLGCTYAVIEVGLGGTYDSTNVISRPEACAIVSISYDHTEILGGSLSEIAAAKSGIIKPLAPVIVGSLPNEALDVVYRKCSDLGCDLSCFGINFAVAKESGALVYRDSLSQFPITLALQGEHQFNNMGIAIRIGRLLGMSEEECQRGVANCRWPGRAEQLIFTPDHDVVFDCAHNTAGIETLVSFSRGLGGGKRTIVFGALETKDWQDMIDLLIPLSSNWMILRPDSSRAVDNSKIYKYLKDHGQQVADLGSRYEDVAEQIRRCSGYWLVSGSIYMVGKLRALISTPMERFWEPSRHAMLISKGETRENSD